MSPLPSPFPPSREGLRSPHCPGLGWGLQEGNPSRTAGAEAASALPLLPCRRRRRRLHGAVHPEAPEAAAAAAPPFRTGPFPPAAPAHGCPRLGAAWPRRGRSRSPWRGRRGGAAAGGMGPAGRRALRAGLALGALLLLLQGLRGWLACKRYEFTPAEIAQLARHHAGTRPPHRPWREAGTRRGRDGGREAEP